MNETMGLKYIVAEFAALPIRWIVSPYVLVVRLLQQHLKREKYENTVF